MLAKKVWTSEEIAKSLNKGHHRIIEKIRHYIEVNDSFKRACKVRVIIVKGKNVDAYDLGRGATIFIIKRFTGIDKEIWARLGINLTMKDYLEDRDGN